MKRRIRLTEGDLKRIVKESVKRIIRESGPSKGMRTQMFDRAYDATRGESPYMGQDEENGYITLSDILDGNERPDEILQKVEEYLDDNCSNGQFGRWTSFGQSVWNDAQMMVQKLSEVYNEFLS